HRDLLHGIRFVDDPCDSIEDRIAKLILSQEGQKRAVSAPMGQTHAGNIERLGSARNLLASFRDEQELRPGIDARPNEPGAPHPVDAHSLPADPLHTLASRSEISFSRTVCPSFESK